MGQLDFESNGLAYFQMLESALIAKYNDCKHGHIKSMLDENFCTHCYRHLKPDKTDLLYGLVGIFYELHLI